jgi:hypothetical protein
MAKMTLLELTQKVLNSLNSDEVESITDTVEAIQVAGIIEDVYRNLTTNTIIPEHSTLLKVEALGDGTRPNYLRLPTEVSKISSFRYNRATETFTTSIDPETHLPIAPTTFLKSEYKAVSYLLPEEFINRIMNRDQDDVNMEVVTDFSGIKFIVQNDKPPQYWTSFDDEFMVFDSYNRNVDTTLQSSKSMAFGVKIPVFTLVDSFIPDIDENLFPLLLNEAKSWAHIELKQQAHQKAEQQSRRQRVTYQNDRERFQKNDSYPGYGRNRIRRKRPL